MRGLTILTGYICAAIAAPAFWFLGNALPGLIQRPPTLDELAMMSTTILAMAGFAFFLSAPIAVPAIRHAENQRKGTWWHFMLAGLIAGLLIAILLGYFFLDLCDAPDAKCETPFVDKAILFARTGFAGGVAGFIYWLIAWRLFPPIETAEERQI